MNYVQGDVVTPRLSIVVLAKNNARELTATLESIEDAADEVIVVDCGIRDSSTEFARQLGAHVLEFEWCDDFAAARNYGLANATGDWVLWLDSGETISAADAAQLRTFVQSTGCDSQVFMLVLQLPLAPGMIAPEQIAQIRLVPRQASLRFAGRVRESLFESVSGLGLEIEGLPWRIRRPACDVDPQAKRQRARDDQRLAELEMNEVGRLPQLINCAADAAQTLGDTQAAVKLYSETLRRETSSSGDRLEAFYGLLASLDGVPKSRSTQLSLCVQALDQFPLDAQLLCAMGGYLQHEGRSDLAERAYETAFRYGRVNPLVWHLGEITSIAATCYAGILQLNGKDEAALELLQQAMERDGASPRLSRALMDLHIILGQPEEALAQVNGLAIDDDSRTLMNSVVRGACLAVAKDWTTARSYLQTAYDAGSRDVACLRWLAFVQMALSQFDQARGVLEYWQQIEPASPEIAQLLASFPDTDQRAAPPDMAKPSIRVDSPRHNIATETHSPLSSPAITPNH